MNFKTRSEKKRRKKIHKERVSNKYGISSFDRTMERLTVDKKRIIMANVYSPTRQLVKSTNSLSKCVFWQDANKDDLFHFFTVKVFFLREREKKAMSAFFVCSITLFSSLWPCDQPSPNYTKYKYPWASFSLCFSLSLLLFCRPK